MKLRELKKGRLAAWPLTWGGGAYDARSPGLSDTGGENSVLVDARAGAAEPEDVASVIVPRAYETRMKHGQELPELVG